MSTSKHNLIELRNAVTQNVGNHVTVTVNSYGHDRTYSGLLGIPEQELVNSIFLSKEKNQDTGIGLPLLLEQGGIKVLEFKRIVRTDNQEQIYPTKK